MRVLVTRPQPGASATAARLTALGHDVLVAPLLTIEPRDWEMPGVPVDALVLTSANTVRLWGDRISVFLHLPVFAVGGATAAAARRAGFGDVTEGDVGVAALAAALAGKGLGRVLHLAGADRTAVDWPAGLSVETRTVYAALPATTLPDEVAVALAGGAVDASLLFSPRTAAVFAALCDAHGIARGGVAIASISAAAGAAAGRGWRSAAVAGSPTEAALFAAAGLTSAAGGVEEADGAAAY